MYDVTMAQAPTRFPAQPTIPASATASPSVAQRDDATTALTESDPGEAPDAKPLWARPWKDSLYAVEMPAAEANKRLPLQPGESAKSWHGLRWMFSGEVAGLDEAVGTSVGIKDREGAVFLVDQLFEYVQWESPLDRDLRVYEQGNQKLDGMLALVDDLVRGSGGRGQLAVQIVAASQLAERFMKMVIERHEKGIDDKIADKAFSRAMQLLRFSQQGRESLARMKRSKQSTHRIQVQHITVNEGGQAVVGQIPSRGGKP